MRKFKNWRYLNGNILIGNYDEYLFNHGLLTYEELYCYA